ncbi:F-box/FBD/LRR-repeat protein At4g26340 [Brassica napus]|nr:F-box/FBD/LRR-repeat protein At4g26340 [Brassica napus]
MDILSALSDDLLLRILSFVPTKDVVATSLLSKRWEGLWTSVSKLSYDDSDHTGDYKNFSQFVYRSLLSNNAPVLDKLHLKLGPDCPFIDVDLWTNIALTRRVRELEIDLFSKEESFNLPNSLYTSETLEILTLISCVLVNVPSSVCLPSLKTLKLDRVDYTDNATLPRLLSGCPNLEVLFLERHVGDETTDSIVVAPSLQRLTMLDTHAGTCGRFMVDVPSLKHLEITDSVAYYDLRRMKNMPVLEKACVWITNTSSGVTQEFLKALTSVHRLSLSLSLSKVMHPSGMTFNQLVHLDLYTLTEGWWGLLICMLLDSPKLRFLRLSNNKLTSESKEIPIGWSPPSSVPECLVYSLEAFVWIGYNGRQDSKMAIYLLKNTACLKTATFSPDSTDLGEKYQMLKVLASVATMSTSSQLLFD